MNRKTLLSVTTFAVALLGAGAAFAQEATSDAWMQAAMSKSRAQVHAELQQARKDGTIRATAAGYIEPFTPVASRAAVHADAVAALRSGEQAVIDAEAYAFAPQRAGFAPILLATK
jgi:uncharacterized protein YdbL (DUF1318 family)